MHDCDAYLKARTGCFRWRSVRYRAAWEAMVRNGGLSDDDIVLDLGAGWTELDAYLRTTQQWRGRYWPVDGWMGIDLRNYEIPRYVEWVVMLEVIEHLEVQYAARLLEMAMVNATKGVVLTVPNHGVVDIFAMDSTHVFAPSKRWLNDRGFTVEERKLYGTDNDSLLAWWSRG